jgi:hypothetical protein
MRLSARKSTSPVRPTEKALDKASVTARLTRSMLFPSLAAVTNRLRRIVSRPIRNSSVEIGGESKQSEPRRQVVHADDRLKAAAVAGRTSAECARNVRPTNMNEAPATRHNKPAIKKASR